MTKARAEQKAYRTMFWRMLWREIAFRPERTFLELSREFDALVKTYMEEINVR